MSGSETVDQAARDDAHLRSLGIKPELRRSLGFVANFALAFSYISVSTGTFTNQAVAFGVGGPAIFWAWPLVILGQTFVALNFAELASHFPVAGSIYQWSKRLSNRTLGWFTGWIYFWAGVITVTAVAATVPLVMSTIWPDQIKLGDPSPIGAARHAVVHRARRARIDHDHQRGRRAPAHADQQHRRRRRDRRHARVRADPAVLREPPVAVGAVRHVVHEQPRRGQLLPGVPASARSWRCSSCTGSTPPARSARRRWTPAGRRHAACSRPSGCRASSGAIFLLAVTLSFQDMNAAVASGQAFGFPIADTIKQNLTFALGGFTLGDLYLVVILIAVYVCTLAIHGATVRLMFSMGRDRRLPLGGLWGHVNHTLRTPGQRRDHGRDPRGDPVRRHRRRVRDLHRDRRDRHDLHRLLPVQLRRPHRPQARLAAPGRLVQPRQLGHDPQHLRPGVGRVHGHQHRHLDRPRPVRRVRQRPAQHVVEPASSTRSSRSAERSRTSSRRGRSSRRWSGSSSASAPCTTSSPNGASPTRPRSRRMSRPAKPSSAR